MHIHALDSYRPGQSPIHRLDARVKFLLTVFFILTAALTPDQNWLVFACLEGWILLQIVLSQVGVGLVQKRALIALPFALAAVAVIFSTPGEPLIQIPFLGQLWMITDTGLGRFGSIVVRSYLSVQAAVLLAATTLFPDLLWGMRALRIPAILVSITGFLYRYLFVLADEAQRLMRAREARSVARAPRSHPVLGLVKDLVWRAQVTGAMAGSLFIRSYERSERIYAAMLARGYDGEVRTLSPPTLRFTDVIFGLVACLFLIILFALSHFQG